MQAKNPIEVIDFLSTPELTEPSESFLGSDLLPAAILSERDVYICRTGNSLNIAAAIAFMKRLTNQLGKGELDVTVEYCSGKRFLKFTPESYAKWQKIINEFSRLPPHLTMESSFSVQNNRNSFIANINQPHTAPNVYFDESLDDEMVITARP